VGVVGADEEAPRLPEVTGVGRDVVGHQLEVALEEGLEPQWRDENRRRVASRRSATSPSGIASTRRMRSPVRESPPGTTSSPGR
jgi:hypothetical protein